MDSEWLKTQFLLNPEKTKAGLAQAMGVDAPTVSKILAGGRQIKAHEYAAMRRYFGLPVDGEKAAGATGGRSYVLAPLDPGLKERDTDTPQESWVMPASLFAARTRAPSDQIKVFSVQEHAMAPDFMPGEQVLVDLSDRKPSPAGVFIVSDGIGHIIRQCEVLPHAQPAKIKLSAANSKYQPMVVEMAKTEIIGRVIAKLEWM